MSLNQSLISDFSEYYRRFPQKKMQFLIIKKTIFEKTALLHFGFS